MVKAVGCGPVLEHRRLLWRRVPAELKVDCGGAEQLGGSVSCEKNILSDRSIAHNLLTLCYCNGYPHNLGTDCIACP